MPAVAPTWLVRVVNLPAFQGRNFRVRWLVQNGDPPAHLFLVVIFFPCAVGACEDLGPGRRVEYVIDRWGRAVVKIRSACPDAVQRRRLIAANGLPGEWLAVRPVFLGEPAFPIMCGGFFRGSFGEPAI